MSKVVYIDDYLKSKKQESEPNPSYNTSESNNLPGKLYPIIDNKSQELLGYKVRFPVPTKLFAKELPENVVEFNKKQGKKIHVPRYDDAYSGMYILDSNKNFLGTIYDPTSKSQEFSDEDICGILVLYHKNSIKLIGVNSQNGLKVNYTAINESDPLKLFLKSYDLYSKNS